MSYIIESLNSPTYYSHDNNRQPNILNNLLIKSLPLALTHEPLIELDITINGQYQNIFPLCYSYRVIKIRTQIRTKKMLAIENTKISIGYLTKKKKKK